MARVCNNVWCVCIRSVMFTTPNNAHLLVLSFSDATLQAMVVVLEAVLPPRQMTVWIPTQRARPQGEIIR